MSRFEAPNQETSPSEDDNRLATPDEIEALRKTITHPTEAYKEMAKKYDYTDTSKRESASKDSWNKIETLGELAIGDRDPAPDEESLTQTEILDLLGRELSGYFAATHRPDSNNPYKTPDINSGNALEYYQQLKEKMNEKPGNSENLAA